MNVRRRKLLLVLIAAGLLLMISGCQAEEPVVVDEADLVAVSEYVNEMTIALNDETLEADLRGWVRAYYEDDLPLFYDEERREWLAEHQAVLVALRERHRGSGFPDEAEIASWQVLVVRGGEEWLLEGAEVNGALEKLEQLYSAVVNTIDLINEQEGELDLVQSEAVLALLEAIEPMVAEVRGVFFH